MNKLINPRKIFFLVALLAVGFLGACANEAPVTIPPVSAEKPSEPPAVSPPVAQPSTPTNRVDIVYFHPKVRCGACISVELRTKDVLSSYFKDAIDSDKLTFQSYELQDKQNTSMVKKYGALGSQLFITTVKNGVENIKHIEDVWMPKILNDGVAFDEFMRKLISQSLTEVS
ncbi:nitrophenyl compound nitroreductase subunit ArsF family protein [Chloroflexota bacterium]